MKPVKKAKRNADCELIRHVKKSEWDMFIHFLERCYGHEYGFFGKHYPDLYRCEKSCLENMYIIEKDGRIMSHVGLFPLEAVSDGIRINIGSIGGVATIPEGRGKGFMGKLLHHVIGKMKENKMPVSVLWGDRQRYGTFGWENAGERILLHITSRSISIGLRFGRDVEVTALEFTRGIMHISKKKIKPYTEIDGRDAARLLIGGPFPEIEKVGRFAALLPLPIHIPELDKV